MATRGASFGSVWRYQGPRGVVWRIRYRDASGRRVMETLGREPDWNRTRARAELRRRQVEVEKTGYRRPQDIRLAEFAGEWLTDYLPSRGLKASTLVGYRHNLRAHLIPALGRETLTTLEARPELIERYATRKLQSGLSAKTVTNHLLVLQLVLKRAVRLRLIGRNPVLDVDRPRVTQPELNVLTEAEIARLWGAYHHLTTQAADAGQGEWWQLAWTLTFTALGTALRQGELLALTWRDVELLEGRLHVRRARVRGEVTTPKTRASRRVIELGPRTTRLLAEHWARSAYQGEDELVFCHPQLGTPVDPSRLSRAYLRPALREAGITKPFRPFHDLRHTALTHEAAAGNPMAYVQMRAGHSQIQITQRYIHAAQVLFPGAAERGEARIFAHTPTQAAQAPGPGAEQPDEPTPGL